MRDQTLVVDARDQRHVWQCGLGDAALRRTPRVTINVRDLDHIEAAGAVKLRRGSTSRVHGSASTWPARVLLKIGELQATTLKLDGSGATKVEIAGKVMRQEIDLSGAGSYQAAKLDSDEAVVGVSGAGKAMVNARNTLTVDISGAGKVEYVGDPKIKQSISGVGKVSRREPS